MAEEKMNMYSRVQFVQRLGTAQKIEKVKHKREELEKIIKEMRLKEAEYESRPNHERRMSKESESDDDVENMYDLDTYDDEDDTPEPLGIESLILNNPPETDSEDSDAEEDEFSIKPDDNIILAAHVADDVSLLEAYVFNHEKAEFFLLHDVYLPSFPLAVQFLDFNSQNPNEQAKLAAIGYISNEIDLWDLTVTGSLEPTLSLSNKKSGKGKRHTKAVMDLAWNPKNRHVLGSSSADKTVRLWDLNNGDNFLKLDTFDEKVQTIDFHSEESTNLLTGDCSGHVQLCDCRSPGSFKTWTFEKEIEVVKWSSFDNFQFLASTNIGTLHCVDIRNAGSLWDLKAHDKELTGFSRNIECPDFLVTVSIDEAIKVWDLKDNQPKFVIQKDVNIGEIYCIDSCPDVPYVFCLGGKHKENPMYLWDSRENEAVVRQFHDRVTRSDFTAFTTLPNHEPQPGPSTSNHQPVSAVSSAPGRSRTQKKKPRHIPRPGAASTSQPGSSSGGLPRPKKKGDKKKRPGGGGGGGASQQ